MSIRMDAHAAPQAAKASFEIAPPPIPRAEIARTVHADVVVIGAGFSRRRPRPRPVRT